MALRRKLLVALVIVLGVAWLDLRVLTRIMATQVTVAALEATVGIDTPALIGPHVAQDYYAKVWKTVAWPWPWARYPRF